MSAVVMLVVENKFISYGTVLLENISFSPNIGWPSNGARAGARLEYSFLKDEISLFLVWLSVV